jgi:hypothetical protein
MKTQKRVVCDVELDITVKSMKILSVAKQYFYGKFLSPATIKRV